ncbi:MAG: SDR family oxidoreductase, partial [Proteobacteria bacterium]|nr:SDR family oxidoreductase [Pseudomonadota bacterium]
MTEGLAIVGMACRFPDADTPADLWNNVLARRRAFRRIPAGRHGIEGYLSADGAPDTSYVKHVAVLEGYEFDRLAYRVTGDAYRSSDLSHWLALEVAGDALRDAGFEAGAGLPGDRTGVIVGNTLTGELSRANGLRLRWPYVHGVVSRVLGNTALHDEEQERLLREMEALFKHPFPPVGEETLAGGLANTIAGRICNHFDLGGGGFTVDGACCSSLLAVAQSCSALIAGDVDVAIAGGVDLSLDPFELVGFSALGALSRGDMRVYDEQPTGFLPGEGCGFVVLMRESDALAFGRSNYARISGWGVSSDGSGGITRPDTRGQKLALARAYRRAGVAPDAAGYVEGHGTGTRIGDLVELRAIAEVRGSVGQAARSAAIGSVKANIGHTKAAAGIAGLIKTAMAVRARTIPPATGIRHPHPVFRDEARCLRIARDPEPWPDDRAICAGVSAFGFGGIDVHVTLHGNDSCSGARVSPLVRRLADSSQDCELFVLAAKDAAGLLARLDKLLGIAPHLSWAQMSDLAASLAGAAAHGDARAAVVAAMPEELHERLARLGECIRDGETSLVDTENGLFAGLSRRRPRIAFLFPGQAAPVRFDAGSIGRCIPDAADVFDRADLSRPSAQSADDEVVSTEFAQLALVAAAVAGNTAMSKLGIEADVALGHSLGELAALFWSGAIDERDLCALARKRGHAMANAGPHEGAMVSVAAPLPEVESLTDGDPDLEIGAINGVDNIVVTGSERAAGDFRHRAQSRGVRTVRLPVSHAFHSRYMQAAGRVLDEFLAQLPFSRPQKPVVSSVTGARLTEDQDLRALLVRQLTSPVRYADAFADVCRDIDLCIEIGSGTLLQGLAGNDPSPPVASLDVGAGSLRPFLSAVAAAYAVGTKPDLAPLFERRFTRPLSSDWSPAFIENPCTTIRSRRPVSVSSGPGPQPTAASPASDDAPGADTVGDGACAGPSILEALRQAVAERGELPIACVRNDSRLLKDLHLNSIAVSQVVAEVARSFDLAPPVQPTEFAASTLEEIATALQELSATAAGQTSRNNAPDGLGRWVRAFDRGWLETPLEHQPETPVGEGRWTLMASDGVTAGTRLQTVLDGLCGSGVVVLLSPERSDAHIPLLLAAAKHVIDMNPDEPRHFVLCQEDMSCGSFARTLHLETPGITVCVLEAPCDEKLAGRVLREIAVAERFHEVRYTPDGRRYTPRFAPSEPDAVPALPFGPDDRLLVSGGGKGIAAECALGIARRSGVRLLLLGRSDPARDAELSTNLERFSAAGIDAVYARADVTDAASVARAVTDATADGGKVAGILHGAGINRPASIRNLEADDFHEICTPKVDGLRNILAAVDPDALRLVVSFGSVIARSGLQGEAHYGLANEWLAKET